MARKKIGIISPLLTQGGLEKVAATLSLLLSEEYDIYIIVFNGEQIDYDFKGTLIRLGINLNERNILKRIVNTLKTIRKLRKIKKMLQLDATISMGEICNIPNILSGGKNNFVTIHENRFHAKNDFQRQLVNTAIKYLYKHPNIKKIVPVSHGIQEDMVRYLKLPSESFEVIYNPHDIQTISEKSSEDLESFEELFKHNPVLINMGRLSFPKGQWYLLRIFNQLKKHHPFVKLAILGNGEFGNDLIEFSKKLGLKTFVNGGNDNFHSKYDVYFLGFQSNPYKFLSNSELYISTSLWEGLGNHLIEALACKQCVVSTDCKSGPDEILQSKVSNNIMPDNFGILLPTFKSKLLFQDTPLTEEESIWLSELDNLLNNKEKILDYKERALERAKFFDSKNAKKQWKQLIDA